MGQIIRVKCNGANKHINAVDLAVALLKVPITRLADASSTDLPERIVLRCHYCTDGRVIIEREMIEDARRRNPLS